jgi:hypothetical protein
MAISETELRDLSTTSQQIAADRAVQRIQPTTSNHLRRSDTYPDIRVAVLKPGTDRHNRFNQGGENHI